MVPFNSGGLARPPEQNQTRIPDGAYSFEADLRKTPGMRLGIDVVLVSSPHGCGLVVERVNEGGLVEAWNRRSRDPMRIRSGDFIVRVNSIEGEISALASELRSGSDVRIMIQRAARDTQNLHTWKDLQACIANKRTGQNPGSVPNSGQQSLFSEPPPELAGNASSLGTSGYPGPVGLPGQQNNPRPKAPGVTSWGGQAPGYQHIGMPNFLQGAESQQQWQGNRWPGNQWAMSDGPMEPEVRLPPSRLAVGTTEPEIVGMEATPDKSYSFEVTLSKPERARLGIDVMPHTVSQVADFCGLTVKRVSKGGVVDEWNHSCVDPRAQVCPGDRIVKVNGVTSDFAQMWEMLCTQRELKVTVRRCSNQLSSSQGHQGFGVGPVQLPGRGAPMLENLRPALTDDSRGSGPQAGKSPPAISLPQPNQASLFARDGSQRVGQIAGNTGFGASGISNSGNNTGYGFGKGGASQEAQAAAFQSNNANSSMPPAPQLGGAAGAAGSPAGQTEAIRFDVTLENSKSKRVGMDVIMVQGNQICGFVVERVMEGGRVDLWNKQSQPPYTVQTGDYIVQVNGVGNWQSLSKMAEEFVKEGRTVSFTIQRGTPVFDNRMARNPAEASGGKQSKRQEADTRSPPKAPGASFDAADSKGRQSSEQARPEASPPMPTGLSKMSPQAPSQNSGLRQTLSVLAPPPEASSARIEEVIEETASSEAPVDMPAPFAAMAPKLVDEGLPEPPLEPPPGLSLPSQDLGASIATIAAAPNMPPPPPPPQESLPAMTSLTAGVPPPPMAPPPPPRQAEPAGESDSVAEPDVHQDSRPTDSASDVGKARPGRSDGASIGRTSEETVPPGLSAVEEALALENKEDEASKTAHNLLASSLQLKDEDLTALLQVVLSRKPHLRVTVTKTLAAYAREDRVIAESPRH